MYDSKKIGEVIGVIEDYYEKHHQYIPLDCQELTDEQRDIVLDNPDIFFQASKSRILLVIWLLDIVRKTFELYGYSSIDVKNETYDTTRTKYKTKALSRDNYLDTLGCHGIMTYKEFVPKEQYYRKEYNKYVPEEKKLSDMPQVSVKEKSDSLNLREDIENILQDKRSAEILYLRSTGKTLEEIGKKYNITRERARQIEKKPKTEIQYLLGEKEDLIIEKLAPDSILNQEEAKKMFGDDIWPVVRYVIVNDQNKKDRLKWKFFEPMDIIYFEKSPDFYEDLMSVAKTASGKDMVKDFTDMMREKGYASWNEQLTKKYLNTCRITDKDKLISGKTTITDAICVVAKNFYPDGICVTDKESVDEFGEKITELFAINPTKGRALMARMQDVLVLCAKGRYMSKDLIKIDDSLFNEILDFVKKNKSDRVTYEFLYEKFEKELLEKTSIDNHYYLHGALREYVEDTKQNVMCYRYYIGKPHENSGAKSKSKEFFRTFYDYTLSKKCPVSTDTLLKELPGWNEMYLRYGMLYFPQIVQWNKDEFLNLDAISVSKQDKDELEDTVEKCLDNRLEYTSSHKLYSTLKSQNPSLLKRLGVKKSHHLFFIINYLFSDKYGGTRPHIVRQPCERFTTQNLIERSLYGLDIINKKELIDEITSLYGARMSTLDLFIYKKLSEEIKYSQNEFIPKEKINLTKDDKEAVDKFIKKNMIKSRVFCPNSITNWDGLPDISPYKWNSWMICDIVRLFDIGDYKQLGQRNCQSQKNMVILISGKMHEKTKEDVFAWLVKNDFDGDASDSDELFEYEKNLGFFQPSLLKCQFVKMVESDMGVVV